MQQQCMMLCLVIMLYLDEMRLKINKEDLINVSTKSSKISA